MNKMYGDILKSIMKEKGVTAAEVSKRAGIDKTVLSKILNNKRRPSLDVLEKLADDLDVSMDRLFGRSE